MLLSVLSSVFEPAYDLVAVDYAAGPESFIVMQISDACHGHGLANDGSKNMAAGPAAVDRYIMPRGVDGGTDLAVTPQTDMLGRSVRWRDAIELKVAGLVIAVEESVTADVDVAGEINFRTDSRLHDDLRISAHGDCPRDINLDVSRAAIGVAGQG